MIWEGISTIIFVSLGVIIAVFSRLLGIYQAKVTVQLQRQQAEIQRLAQTSPKDIQAIVSSQLAIIADFNQVV